MKKMILGPLGALCAMLALPAIALATPAHVTPQPEGTLSIHGGASALSRVAGGGATGTTTKGFGSFESTTTGKLKFTFTGVKSSIGTNCTNTGVTGEVTTTELTFHIVMLAANTPGVLITGNKTVGTEQTAGEGPWGHHFVDFGCGIFLPTVQVRGNGFIGTITGPQCGKKSSTVTMRFEPTGVGSGVQKHITYTGSNYDLESSFNGGPYTTSALEVEAVIAFAGPQTPELVCT